MHTRLVVPGSHNFPPFLSLFIAISHFFLRLSFLGNLWPPLLWHPGTEQQDEGIIYRDASLFNVNTPCHGVLLDRNVRRAIYFRRKGNNCTNVGHWPTFVTVPLELSFPKSRGRCVHCGPRKDGDVRWYRKTRKKWRAIWGDEPPPVEGKPAKEGGKDIRKKGRTHWKVGFVSIF